MDDIALKPVHCLLALLLALAATCVQAQLPKPVELFINDPISAPQVDFSLQTRAWLATQNTVNVAIWTGALPPLQMGFEQTRFEGVTADYLGILQQSLGLTFKLQRYPTRAQAHAAVERGEADLLAVHDVSEGQDGEITQSRPYLLNRKVIVRRIGETLHPSKDLQGQRLAYVGDNSVGATLQKQYPGATLIQYSNHLIALASLTYDQADAMWTDAITAEFLIRIFYSNDAYVAGDALPTSADINFAVSDRKPQLLAAINSTLDAIPPTDMMRIITRWGLNNNFVLDEPPLTLDAKEIAWLASHPKIKVLIAGAYAPLTFFDDHDQLQGLSADLLKIIRQRTGLEMEVASSSSIPGMLKELENGQANLIAALAIGDMQLSPEQYTRPFLVSPFVVVTQQGPGSIRELAELNGKRLAIPFGNPLAPWLRQHYPQITQVSVPTSIRGFEMLSAGDVSASVNTQFGADYFIKHHFQHDLQIAMVIGDRPARIAMAVGPRDAILKGIIDKVLLEIPHEEVKTLTDRWRNHSAPAVASSWSTYKDDVYKVVGIALACLLVFLLWIYYLQLQIRKRRAAERALNDQLVFSKTLIDDSPIALYVRGKDGRLAHCNKAYLEFMQTTQETVMGKTLMEAGIVSAPVNLEYERIYQETEQHGKPTFADLEIEVNGIKRRIYHWTLPILKSAGEFSGVIGGWLDISEREQLMEQLRIAKQTADEANESKSTFLASMSHEIRTPISALIGLIEMLRLGAAGPQQVQENLAVAHQSAQSLLLLVGDILDLSKIEAGAMKPLPRPTDLKALLESIHKLFAINAQTKNLKFELVVEARESHVLTDALMVNQIVANLISNAIKFTQRGFVELALKQLDDDPVSGFACYSIEVRDSGSGLDDSQKKAIFEPFVQVAPNPVPGRSTGLGLSICARLATLLDARLSVDSQPGIGSCFKLQLSAERSSQDASPLPHDNHAAASQRLNILVVEDHAPNRLLLCQQLEYLGHRAVPCDDGVTALAEWEHAEPPFDLTITDCNMPEMNGYELTREMRRIEQSRAMGAHPIFGLTANAQSQIIQDCLDAGMTQCLFKPLGIEALTLHIGTVATQVERRARASRTSGGELQKLRVLRPDAYGPLVDEMVSTNRKDGLRLAQLVADNELQKLASLAHKIKGGAQLADALEVIEACVQLEALADQGQGAACAGQVDVVLNALQALEQQLLADR